MSISLAQQAEALQRLMSTCRLRALDVLLFRVYALLSLNQLSDAGAPSSCR